MPDTGSAFPVLSGDVIATRAWPLALNRPSPAVP